VTTTPPTITTDGRGRTIVVKAGVGDLVERRRQEAEFLRRARHPGVVELLGVHETDERIELHLAHVPGPTLSTHPPLPTPRLARIGSALAATLADLHGLGVVHGNICADHVLVTSTDRVVICGLSDAASCGADDGLPPSCDTVELGRLLKREIERSIAADVARPSDRLVVALSSAADAAADPDGGMTADDLAEQLASLVDPADPAPDRPKPHKRLRWPTLDRRQLAGSVALGVAVVGAVAAFALRSGPSPTAATPPSVSASSATPGSPSTTPPAPPTLVLTAPSPTSAPCPTVPVGLGAADVDGDGCAESWWTSHGRLHAGGRTYVVGSPDDLVAVGDWDCDGAATPALVDGETGGVFLFHEWATPEGDVSVDAAGIVHEPETVSVLAGDGCESLEVAGPAGVAVFPDRPAS